MICIPIYTKHKVLHIIMLRYQCAGMYLEIPILGKNPVSRDSILQPRLRVTEYHPQCWLLQVTFSVSHDNPEYNKMFPCCMFLRFVLASIIQSSFYCTLDVDSWTLWSYHHFPSKRKKKNEKQSFLTVLANLSLEHMS